MSEVLLIDICFVAVEGPKPVRHFPKATGTVQFAHNRPLNILTWSTPPTEGFCKRHNCQTELRYSLVYFATDRKKCFAKLFVIHESRFVNKPHDVKCELGAGSKISVVMAWINWCVVIAAALWAFSTNVAVRRHYKTSATPVLPAKTCALVQALSVVVVVVFHRSPLHLLWLFRFSYLAGFFSQRSKTLAFLPWLWGYLLACTIPANW